MQRPVVFVPLYAHRFSWHFVIFTDPVWSFDVYICGSL